MDLLHYFKVIRPFNILIIILTQASFHCLIINTSFSGFPTLAFPNTYITLIICCTSLMAAASYVINDIQDFTIDHVNKVTNQVSWTRSHLSELKKFYYFLLFSALSIAIFISYSYDKWHLLWIFPLCMALLHLYSTTFKRKGIIGNLIVALFCAFVIGILLIAEYESLQFLRSTQVEVFNLLMLKSVAYILFAFWLNLIREIVKDAEDVEGDRLINSQSIPIVFGLSRTNVIVQWMYSLLILGLLSWLYTLESRLIIGCFLILLPAILGLTLSYRLRDKKDYSKLSLFLKIQMLLGLIFIFVIP